MYNYSNVVDITPLLMQNYLRKALVIYLLQIQDFYTYFIHPIVYSAH